MQSPSQMWQRFKRQSLDLILNTKVEIGIGVGVAVAVGLAVGYNQQAERAKTKPVAFSEVGKTIIAYAEKGQTVPPMTRLLARCSDTKMRINEAENFANAAGGSHDRFASELEYKVAPELRVHRTMGEDATVIAQDAREALESLRKYSQANAGLPAVTSSFSQVWKHDWENHYKWVDCSYTTTDSKGNTVTVQQTCREYDHTTHTYTYFPDKARTAASTLSAYLQRLPDLKIDERLVPSSKTDPDNEYAIERSFREALENRIPTTAQALGFANVWNTGSSFAVFEPLINQGQANLHSISAAWVKAQQTARSIEKRTEQKEDHDPPKEYALAKRAVEQSSSIHSMTSRITSGIQQCGVMVPQVLGEVKTYIAAAKDGGKGDLNQLRASFVGKSDTFYKTNFVNGHELNRFSGSEMLILALIGAPIGGALGFGADKLIDAYMRRRRFGNRFN